MANEITLTVSFRCLNGDYDSGPLSLTKQITQSAQGANSVIQPMTTTSTGISVGPVTTYGYMFCRNIDSTNNIVLGSTVNYEMTLKPGEFAIFRRTPGVNMEAKASAGTPKLQVLLLQD